MIRSRTTHIPHPTLQTAADYSSHAQPNEPRVPVTLHGRASFLRRCGGVYVNTLPSLYDQAWPSETMARFKIQLIDGAFVHGSLADQRRRVWPEWQEKKPWQFEKCATGSECLRISWAPPPSLSLVLLQFYIHINGVGDCGGYQLMGNHKREKKVHTTVSVLLWGALFFKGNFPFTRRIVTIL